jgi:hypothetical protein
MRSWFWLLSMKLLFFCQILKRLVPLFIISMERRIPEKQSRSPCVRALGEKIIVLEFETFFGLPPV